jgi:hypothetical protein
MTGKSTVSILFLLLLYEYKYDTSKWKWKWWVAKVGEAGGGQRHSIPESKELFN